MSLQNKYPLFLFLIALLPSDLAWAERDDRNKPINVEANRLTVDDARHTQTLEGDVLLTQGTLTIHADKLVITEDASGFQKGVATSEKINGKASFRQKREGRGDYIQGEGRRIEYDSKTEVTELFEDAWVKNGEDVLRGNYIWYDAISEKYLVNAKPPNAATHQDSPTRVRAMLKPRIRDNPSPPPAPLELQKSNQITTY